MVQLNRFPNLKVGDTVQRTLGLGLTMPLKVTALDDNLITCGEWTFDRATGIEIDDYLQWGPKYGTTGSYLIAPT